MAIYLYINQRFLKINSPAQHDNAAGGASGGRFGFEVEVAAPAGVGGADHAHDVA